MRAFRSIHRRNKGTLRLASALASLLGEREADGYGGRRLDVGASVCIQPGEPGIQVTIIHVWVDRSLGTVDRIGRSKLPRLGDQRKSFRDTCGDSAHPSEVPHCGKPTPLVVAHIAW